MRPGGVQLLRYRPQRNYGCRVHDEYTYFGMKTVVLENEFVRISVLVDKGTDIFEYLYKPTDMDFMWLSSNGVQNPATIPNYPGTAFVEMYEGGWQEIFPNGGESCTHADVTFGQHDEVSNLPWDHRIILDTTDAVSVEFQVRTQKMPFFLTKTLTLRRGSPSLFIEEAIENLSKVQLRYMWGHHIVYGSPFLTTGCKIRVPDGIKVMTERTDSHVLSPGWVQRDAVYQWPFARGYHGEGIDLSVVPDPETPSDILYLSGFENNAWYEVENARLRLGVRVTWDGCELPFLWYWQELGSCTSYPWYGRHFNLGLEPFSSFPTHGLGEAVRNGSARYIGGREVRRLWLKFEPFVLNTAHM